MVVPPVSLTKPSLSALTTTASRPWVRRAGLIGAVALAIRLLYWLAFLRHYVPQSDAGQYLRIAHNFAIGNGIADTYPQVLVHATAFRPPLYPAMLGLLFKVFGTHVAVAQAANAVIGSLVVVLVDIVVTRLATPRAGLIAAAIVAVTPSLLANDLVPLSEPLSLLIFLAIVLLMIEERWIWAGVATGLLLLTRPSAPALLVAAALWLVSRVGWKVAVRFVVAATVIVTPWIIRNEVHFHSPVLVTSNGFNANAIYSPEALRDSNFVDASIDPRFAWLKPKTTNEAQWDRALLRHGVHGALTHPATVVRIVARNTIQLAELLPGHNRWAERSDGRNRAFRTATLPIFYLTTALGLVGLWRWRANRWVWLMFLLGLVLVVPSVLTVPAPRLRAPLDLVLAIGAGLFLAPRAPAPTPQDETAAA
jgi:4-amino-4-deoxy-L-arabinose transferase-like glycosyltransferase